MVARRALVYGILGAGAMSAASALLRGLGVPIRIELILGTLPGLAPGPGAFVLGLVVHLALGGLWGLLYGWLFETVWAHGGAAMGCILAALHASLVGIAIGLTPRFHPFVPEAIPDPGPYFANAGAAGVLSFYAVHLVFGAIVGGGYGHVPSERRWAPAGRL